MGKQLFKGLIQDLYDPNMKFEPGFVYFVREDDTKEHGFIYFNGKKYGTTKEVADKLKEVADKLATLEGVDVEERLKNLEDVSAETRIYNLEGTAIKEVEVNSVNANVENNKATVLVNSENIKMGKELEYSGTTITTTGDTIGDAVEKVIEKIVENKNSTDSSITELREITSSDGNRIANIEKDYLKEEDKTALENTISDLSGTVNDSTVSDVVYDKSAGTVYIKFNNNTKTVGFDVSDFIIDGMLSDVTYDTTAHTMTFKWNTDAGSKTETINIDDIISPYKADGKYIQLGEENTFKAVIGVITFENGQFKSTSKGISDTDNLVGFLNTLLGNINAVGSRVTTLESTSASDGTRISNLESASASAVTRIANIENDYLKGADKTTLENSIAEVRTTANAADTLSKENKGRLDSIGLSVVDGKLCVTFNQ